MLIINQKKKKLVKLIIALLVVMIIGFVLTLVFNKEIRTNIGQKIKEILVASEIETKIDYEIFPLEGKKLSILLKIENKKGIDKIILSDGLTLNCNGKKMIALNRNLTEGDIFQLNVKLKDETVEELYTFVATTKPQMKVTNYDALGDGTTKTIKIEYPEANDNITNYYSLDNGETWNVYTQELDIPNIQRESVLAKIEYNEGKTINKPVSYLEYIDLIRFSEVTWKDGKAQVEISSLNTEYIEYQINSTTGTWINGTNVENLNHNDIVYVRINNGTIITDSANKTIKDEDVPEEFEIEVTDITYEGFTIKGSTKDLQSGIKSYTYVVEKRDGGEIDVSSTKAKRYNVNSVGNYGNSINNTSRSRN